MDRAAVVVALDELDEPDEHAGSESAAATNIATTIRFGRVFDLLVTESSVHPVRGRRVS
jgi:hypothetical protein